MVGPVILARRGAVSFSSHAISAFKKKESIVSVPSVVHPRYFFHLLFRKTKGGDVMNIKYIGSDTKVSEKGKVHVRKGNYTGCGARIDDNPQDWVSTLERVTCKKNGCCN